VEEDAEDIQLEEIARSEEEKGEERFWSVTSSYRMKEQLNFDRERKYKKFLVSDKTGEVERMEIRQI
jgi:hypothetical protein